MARKVPKSFHEMDTKHLMCRNFTHPWEPVETDVTTVKRKKVWVIDLFCARCGGRCQEIYHPTSGDRKRTPIKYPDNYLVKAKKDSWGGVKLFNQNVRLELFTRIVSGDNGSGRRKARARTAAAARSRRRG